MESLSDWEKYIHFDEQDRLVQLAIVHAQFEIIHPFSDGNGRVGRMILPLILHGYGLLSSPMLYLSAYLERNRDIYYERLHQITASGQWDEWVLFFLAAIIEQAGENIAKAKAILELYDRMKKELPGIVATQFSIQTIDTLFNRPIFKSSDFVELSRIPRATAMRILRVLQEKNVLQSIHLGGGRRATTLMFTGLIKITEEKKHNEIY
jgi:Fic family protein